MLALVRESGGRNGSSSTPIASRSASASGSETWCAVDSALWVPQNGAAQPRYRCMCGREFHDERLFLRHEARCDTAQSMYEAEIHKRRTEPLAQSDDEQLQWLRERAERERDFTVKGTSAWDPKRTEEMERRGTLRKIDRRRADA